MRSTKKHLELEQQCSNQDKHHKFKLASQLVKRALTPSTSQRRKPFNFLSLPAEIRNDILSYVLVPGEVHIRATKEHGMKATIKHVRKEMQRFCRDYQQTKYYGTKWRIQYVRETMQCFYLRCQEIPKMPSLPGFQMLATCKSVYEQNHEQVYSSNTFSLPPGPLEETAKHFTEVLQAEHKHMISCVGVKMGLEDLTPAVFTRVQHDMFMSRYAPDYDEPALEWSDKVLGYLSYIWFAKVYFLQELQPLKTVKLAAAGEMLEIDQGDLARIADGFRNPVNFSYCADAEEVGALVEHAKETVRREIDDRVERDGWRGLRAWVYGGGPRHRP